MLRDTGADMKTKYKETAHVVTVLHFHYPKSGPDDLNSVCCEFIA